MSSEEVNEAKRRLHELAEELDASQEKGLQNIKSLEDAQDQIDRVVNAGAKILDYYASLPRPVARSILSDDRVRQLRDDALSRAEDCNMVAQKIFDKVEQDRERVAKVLHRMVQSNATPDQLSRSAPSLVKYLVARMELWDKKVQRYEWMRSVCAATTNLASSTAEMRQEEEAALRLHTGWVVNSKVMQLQSRIALAQVKIDPQARTFEAPVREILIGHNGQVGLLGAFIIDVFPAFISTADAVMKNKGRPLDAEHCAVLEGVMERLSEFASALHPVVAKLNDHQIGADLPLGLLRQIVDGAWITAHQVMRLLELQPKPPAVALPADAGATVPAEPTGKAAMTEGAAARKKGKGKHKPAAGAGSSAARRPELQAAAAVSDTAPAAKVLVRSDLGTKMFVSVEEAHASASAVGARLAIWQVLPSTEGLTPRLERLDELLQFDLAGQQRTVSRARHMKPEDAEHALDTVVKRLQAQATEMQACLAALEEPRQRVLLTPARISEAHDKTGRLKLMLSEAQGLAKSLDIEKAAISIDCMKTYPFPSQNYLEHLRAAEELTPADRPRALNGKPGSLFEIRLQPKALRNGAMPSPMWVHIHTNRPVDARQLAMLDDSVFAACHVKSNEQRGHNRQWQNARAAIGHDNVVIHRGKLTPAFCKSLLNQR
ncbi:hypothetical protein [Mesorhizobium carmichaelinearum]|uniref:hypothetical protein n=1 Tax=Mesorhizobium carmichaelinearum TaxID=1208188 RepID=UPI001FCEBE3E|nr:hypothetical protein [Mesorhizobium carmichaelinearum]